MDELGIKHKRTIPLWPRANGRGGGRTSHCLRQCVRLRLEGKPWQRELQKYLLGATDEAEREQAVCNI